MNDNQNRIPDEYKKYLEPSEDEEIKTESPVKEEPKAPKNKKKKSKALPLLIVAIIILVAGILAAGLLFKDDIKDVVDPTTTVPPEPTNIVTVTFPEGYTIYQIADLLEKNNVCSKEDFFLAVNTPVEGFEITNPDDRAFLLEGYIFPDTYEFYFEEDANTVVKKFLENFNKKITPELRQQASDMGYSVDEILTLASIIQKECDFDIEECQNVSSVFHNRLENKNAYLGSDVTYFYLKNMADYLGGSDSERFDYLLTQYYTYSPYRKGLPVGPICNPGMKAITAALNPADTDYYYFLTDETCTDFYYAETYSQHLKNGKLAGIM